MNDKLQKLYNVLQQKGSVKNLPDFDTFKSDLNSNPSKQQNLYNFVRENEVVKNIPDFDTFQRELFSAPSSNGSATPDSAQPQGNELPPQVQAMNATMGIGTGANGRGSQRQPQPSTGESVPKLTPAGTGDSQQDPQRRAGELNVMAQRFQQAARDSRYVAPTGEYRQDPVAKAMSERARRERDRALKAADTGQGRASSYMGSFVQGLGDVLGTETVRSLAVLQANINPDPVQRAFGNAKLEAGVDPIYNFGTKIGNQIRETFPNNPAFQEQMATQVFTGAGSLAGFAIGGLGSRALKVGSLGAGALGSLSMSGAEYNKALEEGASTEQALGTWLLNLGIGGSEAIPVANALKQLDNVTGGGVKTTLAQGFKGGLEEMIQEIGQNFASNATARSIYDTNRQLLDGVGEGGTVGFILGSFLRGTTSTIGQLKNKVKDKAARSLLEKTAEETRQALDEQQPTVEPQTRRQAVNLVDEVDQSGDADSMSQERRDEVLEIASKLGLETEGKSPTELVDEMRNTIQQAPDVEAETLTETADQVYEELPPEVTIDPTLTPEENRTNVEAGIFELEDRIRSTADTGGDVTELQADLDAMIEAEQVLSEFTERRNQRMSQQQARETQEINDEGESLLRSYNEQGDPGFITEKLRRVARENGIDITETTQPQEVVDQLRQRSRFFGEGQAEQQTEQDGTVAPDVGTQPQTVVGEQSQGSNELSMAIKVGDTVYTAPREEAPNHMTLYDMYDVDLEQSDGGGFMTPDGRYLTRDQAAEYQQALQGEDATSGRGVLSSEDFVPPPGEPEQYQVLGSSMAEYSAEGLRILDPVGNEIDPSDSRYPRAVGEFFAKYSSPAGQSGSASQADPNMRAQQVSESSSNPVEIANTLADLEDMSGSQDNATQNALRERFEEVTGIPLSPEIAQEIQTRTNRETPSMLAMEQDQEGRAQNEVDEVLGEELGDRIGESITASEAVLSVDSGEFFSAKAIQEVENANKPKSSTTIVHMSPSQFFNLVTGSDTDFDTAVLQDIEDGLFDGGELDSLPQLRVETIATDSGPQMIVTGHNGRHNVKVLADAFEAGMIPVRVSHKSANWGEQDMPTSIFSEQANRQDAKNDVGPREQNVQSVFYPENVNARNAQPTGRTIFMQPGELREGESGRERFGPERSTPASGQRPTAGALDLEGKAEIDYEGRAVRVRDTITKLIDALGLNVTTGVTGRGTSKTRGTYDLSTGALRMSVIEDVETLAHEAGHAIEQKSQEVVGVMRLHSDELKPLKYESASEDVALSEGFAEFFRVYLLNRGAAKQAAPNFYKDFEKLLENGPEGLPDNIKAKLDDVTATHQIFLDQPVDASLTADVKMAETRFQKFIRTLKENSLSDLITNLRNKAYTAIIAEDYPLLIAMGKLKDIHYQNTGESVDITPMMDFYKLNRLALDSYSSGSVDIEHGVMDYNTLEQNSPALRDALEVALGDDFSEATRQEFSSYLIARRAVNEWDRYSKKDHPHKIKNKPTKFNKAHHQNQIDVMEDRHDGFEEAADMINEYADALFRKAVDAGLVSQDVYDQSKEAIPFYVPFMREQFKEDGKITEANVESQRTKGKNTLIKSFQGSQRPILDPVEQLMKMSYNFNNAIKQNDVKVALLKALKFAGPGSAEIAEEIPATQAVGRSVSADEIRKQLKDQADWSALDIPDAIAQSLGAEAIDNLDFPDLKFFRTTDVSERGRPIVYAMVDGKRRAIQINNTDIGMGIYNAITELPKSQMDMFVDGLAYPAGMLRTGITSEPSFFIANLVRDQVSAWVLTDVGFTPGASITKDLAKRAMQNYAGKTPIETDDDADPKTQREYSRLYRAFAGISTFNVSALDEDRAKQEIESLKTKNITFRRLKSVRGLNELLDLSEIGTRLSVFQRAFNQAKDQGMSDKEASIEAAFMARDLIDFGRHGSRTEAARRLTPFLNASLQGLDKGQRTLRAEGKLFQVLNPFLKDVAGRPMTPNERAQVANARKAWAKVSSLGIIGAMIASMYADDPDYDEIPDYLKDTHWVLPDLRHDPSDPTPRKFIGIPKPFELAAISNTFESVISSYQNEDPEWYENWKQSMWAIMSPPISVPGLFVPGEVWANKRSFDGRPIVYDRLRGLEPWRQYNAYASGFGKAVGQLMNVPPPMVDHTITGFTGSWGRVFLQATTSLNPDAPTAGADDTWIIRRFIRSADRGNLSAQRFYENAAQLEGVYNRKERTFETVFENDSPREGLEYFKKLPVHHKAYVAMKYLPQEARDAFPGLSLDHPFDQARKATTTISSFRREIFGEAPDEDDGFRDVASNLTADEKRDVDDIIDRLNTAYLRNSLIAAKDPKFSDREKMDIDGILTNLQTVSPEVYAELGRRFSVAGVDIQIQPKFDNFRRFIETENLTNALNSRFELEMRKLVEKANAD